MDCTVYWLLADQPRPSWVYWHSI